MNQRKELIILGLILGILFIFYFFYFEIYERKFLLYKENEKIFPEKKLEEVLEEKLIKEKIKCEKINQDNLKTINEGKKINPSSVYYLNSNLRMEFREDKEFKFDSSLYFLMRLYKENKLIDEEMVENPYLSCFYFKNSGYVKIKFYGGKYLKCKIYYFNSEGEIKVIYQAKDESANCYLFISNHKLYLREDLYFNYFLGGPYAEEFSVSKFYLIDKDKIIPRNSDFEEYYLKRIGELEKYIFEDNSSRPDDKLLFLAEATYNYHLIKKDKIAQEKIDEFFKKYPKVKPWWLRWDPERYVTREDFENYMKDLFSEVNE